MNEPIFSFVPVVVVDGTAEAIAITLRGVSTRHESGDTDQGRVYGDVAVVGTDIQASIYSDPDRAGASLIARGTTPIDGAEAKSFTLDTQNDSGVTGKIKIVGVNVDDLPTFIAIVSFAVDSDVMTDAASSVKFPGFDDEYGFAYFHAQAMKTILGSALPAAAPNLYPAGAVSAFIPIDAGRLPDVTKIANPDALRQAQADFVRWQSAKQKAYLEEWKDVAAQAAADFEKDMVAIREANAPADDEAAGDAPSASVVQFGDFTRG